MKHSPKGPVPSELTDWLAKGNENDNWSPSWDNFQNPEKAAVLKALLTEQGYVCAYCGRSVAAGGSHIEHFWPRSHFPARALDFSNFHASCGPATKPGMSKTCGDAKGAWYDRSNLDLFPSHPTCEGRFGYGASGNVAAFDPADALAATVIETLNLNDDALVLERKAILTALEEDILSGEIDGATKAREIALWRALGGDGRAKSLGHVAAIYLERESI